MTSSRGGKKCGAIHCSRGVWRSNSPVRRASRHAAMDKTLAHGQVKAMASSILRELQRENLAIRDELGSLDTMLAGSNDLTPVKNKNGQTSLSEDTRSLPNTPFQDQQPRVEDHGLGNDGCIDERVLPTDDNSVPTLTKIRDRVGALQEIVLGCLDEVQAHNLEKNPSRVLPSSPRRTTRTMNTSTANVQDDTVMVACPAQPAAWQVARSEATRLGRELIELKECVASHATTCVGYGSVHRGSGDRVMHHENIFSAGSSKYVEAVRKGTMHGDDMCDEPGHLQYFGAETMYPDVEANGTASDIAETTYTDDEVNRDSESQTSTDDMASEAYLKRPAGPTECVTKQSLKGSNKDRQLLEHVLAFVKATCTTKNQKVDFNDVLTACTPSIAAPGVPNDTSKGHAISSTDQNEVHQVLHQLWRKLSRDQDLANELRRALRTSSRIVLTNTVRMRNIGALLSTCSANAQLCRDITRNPASTDTKKHRTQGIAGIECSRAQQPVMGGHVSTGWDDESNELRISSAEGCDKDIVALEVAADEATWIVGHLLEQLNDAEHARTTALHELQTVKGLIEEKVDVSVSTWRTHEKVDFGVGVDSVNQKPNSHTSTRDVCVSTNLSHSEVCNSCGGHAVYCSLVHKEAEKASRKAVTAGMSRIERIFREEDRNWETHAKGASLLRADGIYPFTWAGIKCDISHAAETPLRPPSQDEEPGSERTDLKARGTGRSGCVAWAIEAARLAGQVQRARIDISIERLRALILHRRLDMAANKEAKLRDSDDAKTVVVTRSVQVPSDRTGSRWESHNACQQTSIQTECGVKVDDAASQTSMTGIEIADHEARAANYEHNAMLMKKKQKDETEMHAKVINQLGQRLMQACTEANKLRAASRKSTDLARSRGVQLQEQKTRVTSLQEELERVKVGAESTRRRLRASQDALRRKSTSAVSRECYTPRPRIRSVGLQGRAAPTRSVSVVTKEMGMVSAATFLSEIQLAEVAALDLEQDIVSWVLISAHQRRQGGTCRKRCCSRCTDSTNPGDMRKEAMHLARAMFTMSNRDRATLFATEPNGRCQPQNLSRPTVGCAWEMTREASPTHVIIGRLMETIKRCRKYIATARRTPQYS